jgi:DNA-binding GntR family transcriptional regulator
MSEPFYRQIMTDIRARITAGEWPPGTKLPSTADLVDFYKLRLGSDTLTASTVRHAVSLLIEVGELRGQQGLGVYVPGGPD